MKHHQQIPSPSPVPYLVTAGLLALLGSSGCIESSSTEEEVTEDDEPPVVVADVTVDRSDVLAVVPPYAYGLHTSVYDNALHDRAVPDRLAEAGITMLRYPGGGYSDNYHWSTHTMSPWHNGDRGYLADRSDFGSYLSVIERADVALMITANYGSNLDGTGGGEPEEAAAWVAYANGSPDDDTSIGVDSTGYDWHTVGYWASVRAAEPLDEDDGQNFLRIGRSEPAGIVYWEIGNEVFGNGYYDPPGFELDMHVPYEGSGADGYAEREGHPDLSGTKYGSEVVRYVEAMKAVDPTIKVGAVLNTPPADYSWGPDWNDAVLKECGEAIDFGIIHWYPNNSALLRAPSTTIPEMFQQLRLSFDRHAGDKADSMEVVVTEVGNPVGATRSVRAIGGVYAADCYLSFIEQGATNIAWLELHNGTFLSERHDGVGPAFLGISLANRVAAVGDSVVRARSSRDDAIIAHAGERQDGVVTVMLINPATRTVGDVTIEVEGSDLPTTAQVYRYTPRAEGEAAYRIDGPSKLGASDDNRWELTVEPESLTVLEIEPE